MQVKKGFTLIELLVVIAVIALLMSIIVPSLSKARELARMMMCGTNVKSLVLGANLWSASNNDYAIAGSWWKDVITVHENGTVEDCSGSSILPYIDSSRSRRKDSLTCPTAGTGGMTFYGTNPDYQTEGQEFSFTYASNGYLTYYINGISPGKIDNPPPSSPGLGEGTGTNLYGPNNMYWRLHGATKITSVRNPARIAYFIDHEYYFIGHWFFDPTRPIDSFDEGLRFQTRWHQKRTTDWYGKGMIGWMDGHVSKEPDDFAEVESSGGTEFQRWKVYYQGARK